MFSRHPILVACLLLTAALPGGAAPASLSADQFQFIAWQTYRGLPNNNVTALAQAGDGFLWVATETSLSKFDGERFTIVNLDPVLDFARERIVQLVASRAGTIWIRTAGGGVFGLRGEEIVRLGQPAPAGFVSALVEDESGVLWIGWRGGRVERWKDGLLLGAMTVPACKPEEPLRLVADPAEQRMWVGTGRGFGTFYGAAWAPQPESSGARQPLAPIAGGGLYMAEESGPECVIFRTQDVSEARIPVPVRLAEILVALEDRHGALWLGTREHGIFRLADGKAERFPQPRTDIPALLEDSEGNIWAGTQGSGLVRLRPRGFDVVPPNVTFGENSVGSVTQDTTGALWLIRRSRQILRQAPGQAWETVPLSDSSLQLKCVCADPGGGVWIGTWDGGVWRIEGEKLTRYTEADGLASNRVRALYAPAPGVVWAGTETGLSRFAEGRWESWGQAAGLLAENIGALAADAQGGLWIGSVSGRLSRFAQGKFTNFTRRDGLPGQEISALLCDHDSVWITTDGGGLGRFKDGKFSTLTSQQGLWNDILTTIIAGAGGRYYFGTRSDIFSVPRQELAACLDGTLPQVRSLVIGPDSGFPKIDCATRAQPVAWPAPDGRLYLATHQGAIHLEATQDILLPPRLPVVVTAVTLDEKPARHASELTIPPGINQAEFHFTAVLFTAPSLNTFRYQLEGIDTVWVNAGNVRKARYAALPPGEYRFRVQACANGGTWQEMEPPLAVTVRPHFWQTRWAQAGALVLVSIAIASLFHRWSARGFQRRLAAIEQQRALDRERTRIARDMHDEVGARLTQIALLHELALIQHRPEAPLRGSLQNIADNARAAVRSLDSIVWVVNPRNDRLLRLIEYVSHYASDYLKSLGIRYRPFVASDIRDMHIASQGRHHLLLAVKEILNNIAKHAAATEVRLRIEVGNEQLEIEIEDNGVGFDPAAAAPEGEGVANCRARIADLAGYCDIASRPGAGTRVTLRIPLAAFASPPPVWRGSQPA